MKVNLKIKRIFDIVFTVPLCLIFLPLFVIITIAIKFDSKGPVFFVQNRRGLDFKIIKVIKFRTLKHNIPDPHENYEMLENDVRITRVGSFLRKTSLDELPQLINILMGTMNFVGPRPLVEWESQKSLENYSERFRVKPGITGLLQVSGRNSIDFNARCEKDIEYIHRWSLGLDLLIIIKTPFYLMKTSTIYPTMNNILHRYNKASETFYYNSKS